MKTTLQRQELLFELRLMGTVIDAMATFKSFASRLMPVEKLELTLNNIDEVFTDTFKSGDPVSLGGGYSNKGTWSIFNGIMEKVAGTQSIKILARGLAWQKDNDNDLRYKDSFANVTPQNVINNIFLKAGISLKDSKISTESFPEKSHFWLKNVTFTDAVQRVADAWGIENILFVRNGIWHWRTEPDDKNSASLELRTFTENLTLREGSYNNGKGMIRVEPPAIFVKHSDDIVIEMTDIPVGTYRVDAIAHFKNDDASRQAPYSIIEFSEDDSLLSTRVKNANKNNKQNEQERIILNCVKNEFGQQLNKEDVINAKVIKVSGSGPFTIDVEPLANDNEGDTLPAIRGLVIDNQKLPKTPALNDVVRIGFTEGDATQPFVLDCITNIYDVSNDFYFDGSNRPAFKSAGNPITLFKQAAIASPTGGATVDTEARTAINEIRTLLSGLGLH